MPPPAKQDAPKEEDALTKLLNYLEKPQLDEAEMARIERRKKGMQWAKGLGLALDMYKMSDVKSGLNGFHGGLAGGRGSVERDDSYAKDIEKADADMKAVRDKYAGEQQNYRDRMLALHQYWTKN